MKRLVCDVCETKKPYAHMKHGRYCGLLVCDDCRNNTEADGKEEDDEQWLVVDADGCAYLS